MHTHSHGDHITGHHTLVTKYGVRAACPDFAVKNLTDPASNAISIRTRFPENSPPPQSWLRGVTPTCVLAENEAIGNRLFPIHTPGHDGDCTCWYDIPTKTIITGDSLQGNGTETQGVGFYRSLPDYKETLRKLRTYDIENIICGHDYDGEEAEEVPMEKNKLYNVKAGVYHATRMSEDAKLLIVENANTSRENTEYIPYEK